MIFTPTKPDQIRVKQLAEAERLLLEHQAAAEYHQAIAQMCIKRIERLAPQQQPKDPT